MLGVEALRADRVPSPSYSEARSTALDRVSVATCVHCCEMFRFNPTVGHKLVKCPHCHNESVLGEEGLYHIQSKAAKYCMVGVVFIFLVIAVTAASYVMAKPGAYYILYFGGFIAGVYYLIRGANMRSMKVSHVRHLFPALIESMTAAAAADEYV